MRISQPTPENVEAPELRVEAVCERDKLCYCHLREGTSSKAQIVEYAHRGKFDRGTSKCGRGEGADRRVWQKLEHIEADFVVSSVRGMGEEWGAYVGVVGQGGGGVQGPRGWCVNCD